MKIKFARMAAVCALGMPLTGCSAGSAEPLDLEFTESPPPQPAAAKTPSAGKRLTTVSLVKDETAGRTFQTDPIVAGSTRATVSCQGQGRLSIVIKKVDNSDGIKINCDGRRGTVVFVGGVKAAPDGLGIEVKPSGGVRWWLRVENCAKGHCPQLSKRPAKKL